MAPPEGGYFGDFAGVFQLTPCRLKIVLISSCYPIEHGQTGGYAAGFLATLLARFVIAWSPFPLD
jgi:hypothetical protein